MITAELLRADAALAGLSEDQINAIVTIGTNDTKAEIDKAFGETYRKMDATIEANTGVKRNGDEKTYDYLARATKAQKEIIDPLNAKISGLEADKARLEEQIAKGGDEALRGQLDSTRQELANAKNDYANLQNKLTKMEKDHKAELLGIQVSSEIQGAASGFQFKPEIPQSVTDILVNNAIAKVKGMNPGFIDNGQGGKVLVFHGTDGAVLNNPNNKLNPYTAKELLQNELKDVLATARKQEGAGGPGSPIIDTTKGAPIDVSAAKSQVEADEIITRSLLAQGISIGSPEFQEAKDKAWKDCNVAKLPFKV